MQEQAIRTDVELNQQFLANMVDFVKRGYVIAVTPNPQKSTPPKELL